MFNEWMVKLRVAVPISGILTLIPASGVFIWWVSLLITQRKATIELLPTGRTKGQLYDTVVLTGDITVSLGHTPVSAAPFDPVIFEQDFIIGEKDINSSSSKRLSIFTY